MATSEWGKKKERSQLQTSEFPNKNQQLTTTTNKPLLYS